jgi:hypothetical protein
MTDPNWQLTRRTIAAVHVFLALTALSARAQIPPSVELRVPKPPTLAAADAGAFLAYEVHVTNLTPRELTLMRVDVLDAADGRALHTLADSALIPVINRPGPMMEAVKRPTLEGGLRAVLYMWIPLRDAARPDGLRHRVTLLHDSTEHVIETALVPVYGTGALISPPLRGEWVAVNGPSNASGHRRLVMALNGRIASGQRFGIDFLRLGPGDSIFTGNGSKNENNAGYGADVLAVADGIVVETKDGIPENTEGPQSRAVAINLETVSGNSVVIDLGEGRFAFYAHLIPGSLRVREGDRVQGGQVIGRVGNSGNSTAPHLHFHLVDGLASGTSTLGAEGIPYALTEFTVVGRCRSFDGGGCTRAEPVTVRGGIPLQNQIVRFPE